MKPITERSPKEIREILKKLMFALDADVGEKPACDYAGITKEDFEMLVEKNPDIRLRAERAGSVIGVKASNNIKEAIEDGDVRVSQWYKEHTDPKFSKKVEMQGAVNLSAEDRGEAIENLFDELDI